MTELDQWTEAVARALCEADGRDPDATVDILGARGAVWTSYFDEARAAVLALAPLVIERCAEEVEAAAMAHARAGGQMVEARAVSDAALRVRALIQKEPL